MLMRSAAVEKIMSLRREALLSMDCCLLPEGSVCVWGGRGQSLSLLLSTGASRQTGPGRRADCSWSHSQQSQ